MPTTTRTNQAAPDTSSSPVVPATGEHTSNGTPHGSTALTPHIVVHPATEAIAFYRDALGARVVDETRMGGIVAHAVLDFGNGMLTLGDPMPELGLIGLDPAAGHPYSLAFYCPNVDEIVARAEAAGASVRESPATFVSGDRFASLLDPFGVRWTIMTRVEDLSPDQSAARVAEWATTHGS